MVLVCPVVLSDNVTKESRNFIGGTNLKTRQHTAKFDGHRHCDNEDIVV